MNTAAYFSAPKTLRRIHAGPLGPYVDEFASWLQEQHYSRFSGQRSVCAVANWSRWLQGSHVAARDIDAKLLDRHFLYGARARTVGQDDRRALQKMLAWLQKIGVVPATCFSSLVSQRKTVVDDFEQYMLRQRGLSPTTLKVYLPYISLFLRQRFGEGTIELETLVAHDIIAFVQRNSRSLGQSSVQHLVTALRAFLRYLRHTGKISIDFAACVPSVAEDTHRGRASQRQRVFLRSSDRHCWVRELSLREGAHLFRHSLATEMLRRDASLREIGEVLREIPESGLLANRQRRAKPYLYSESEISNLLAAACALNSDSGLRGHTYYCLFGLLAVAGLRISEALALQRHDVNLQQGLLTIRGAKFGKSRLVPLHESTRGILAQYAQRRDAAFDHAVAANFLLSERGKGTEYIDRSQNFPPALRSDRTPRTKGSQRTPPARLSPPLRNRDVAEIVSVRGGHRTTASRAVHVHGAFPNKRHILVHLGLP